MNDFFSSVAPILRKTRTLLLPAHGQVSCTRKSHDAHDVVTDLDTQIEDLLKTDLKVCFPDIAFVGEEMGGNRSAKRKWLCDPIDGTGHLVRGTPFCTVMLALIEDEVVIFSAIYDFIEDRIYHAQRGMGAYCENQRLSVSTRNLANGYLGWETRLNASDQNVKTHLQLCEKTGFFKTICAGYEFILVATGRIEGRLSFDGYGKDYDYAPGSLLVEEAGGIVKNIGKDTYDYRHLNFIASNPVVYKELTEGPNAIFPKNMS